MSFAAIKIASPLHLMHCRNVPPRGRDRRAGGIAFRKLTTGSGYDYLTRQVAALDATEKGHTGLASYYTERGESPGVWIGSGMDGIDGLAAGDPVTAEQMRALFGCGLHPLAELRQQQLEGPDLTTQDFSECGAAGGAVQDRRQRSAPVSGRGGQAHCCAQHGNRNAGRRLDRGG